MIFKLVVITLLILILFSLGSALFSLNRKGSQADPNRTVKALTVRITLSVALVIVLLIGYKLGLITPHKL